MKTIKYLQDYQNRKKGDIQTVSNNEAHTLIDKGLASLLRFFEKKDTMFRSNKAKLK